MSENKHEILDRIDDINITDEMKTSFLSYAMSVIVSRALPDVRDGLKPVHRRILYGMEELNLTPSSSYKKSARIVGDVMGKYHPHGDSAIYDAMVRLAQVFSTRYPLVNGHGNFGSIDGDGAAAMRYTEAKMAKIAVEMLADIKKDTIDFVDNYDGSEREPSVLPAKFPNLLVNGATGIAVGMATNIPPHHLGESIDAILATMDNPDIDLETLMTFIPAPDFPTGGTIVGLSGVRQAYETGNGSVKIRAKAEISEMKSGKNVITVTEIPYQVNKSRLIEKIAELAKEKRIEGITDLRDESNRDGIRIVIELRRDVSPEVTLNNLYKFTPLQTSFGINMLALVNNQPKVLGLKEIIQHYIDHQLEVLLRKTRFDLDKAKAREHVLEGLIIALKDIDAVIETIRNAYDDAEEQLIQKFSLSEIQAKAILEMRLRRLSGLEQEKITTELNEVQETIVDLQETLDDRDKQFRLIKEDLERIKASYKDPRRSEISPIDDYDIDDEDLIPREDVMIAITQGGYCKRMVLDTARTQNRGGRGVSGFKTHDDDAVKHLLTVSTHDYILFFTDLGKVYKLKGYRIPTFSRTSKGIPLVNILPFEEGETLRSIAAVTAFDGDEALLFISRKGVIKRTALNLYQNIRPSGIRALTLKEGDTVLDVVLTHAHQDIILGASNGKAIRFAVEDARLMGRSAAGVRGIRLSDNEEVVGSALIDRDDQTILVVTEKGYGKRSLASLYRRQNRGGVGVKTLQVTEKNGPMVNLLVAHGDEDVLLLTNKGMMIRLPIDQISETGRITQGVRLMRVQEGHNVVTVALVAAEEDEEQTSLFEAENGLVIEEKPQDPTPEVQEDKDEISLFDLLDEE